MFAALPKGPSGVHQSALEIDKGPISSGYVSAGLSGPILPPLRHVGFLVFRLTKHYSDR